MYAHMRPIGLLPRVFWALGAGTIAYAMTDRYLIRREGRRPWNETIRGLVSSKLFVALEMEEMADLLWRVLDVGVVEIAG